MRDSAVAVHTALSVSGEGHVRGKGAGGAGCWGAADAVRSEEALTAFAHGGDGGLGGPDVVAAEVAGGYSEHAALEAVGAVGDLSGGAYRRGVEDAGAVVVVVSCAERGGAF